MSNKNTSKVSDESYINLQGWMITKLVLKGNDLLVYAIIHGFSQDRESTFHGGLQYLANWCNSTKRGIQKNLDNLINKGYIKKNEIYNGGEKFCTYQTIPLENISIEQSSIGIEQSSINNIDNNKKTNISKDILVADKSAHDNSSKNISEKDTYSNSTDIIVKKRRRLVSIQNENKKLSSDNKPKNKDRWTRFMDAIDRFTDDEKLKDLLKTYANLRLNVIAKRDGDNYDLRCWNGALKTLRNLSDDVNIRCKIVQQSIDLEYRVFCPFNEKSYNRQMWNKNRPNQDIQMTENDATSFKDGKEAKEYTDNLIKENERRGRRAVF